VRRLVPLLLAVSVPFIQNAVDARRGRYQAQEEVLYLWSGQHVRRLVPGLEDLFADIYWLRTVQYFGGQRAFAEGKRFDLLGPLVDITTTLDPGYLIAYRYGAVFMAEPPPGGAGEPRKAVELLKRGALANPSSWQIRQDWGFFVYFFLKDAAEASLVLTEASKLPGAPDWLSSSAADFLRREGDRETSRSIWQHLYEQGVGPMRDNARFNLERLDAADAVDAHQKAVGEFRERFGRLPASLEELSRVGLLRAPVLDPAKVPYHYDAAAGSVSIARQSYLWRAS
jgi:hypothetical protein